MVRRTAILVVLAASLWSGSPAEAGTISGSIRNLDGTPVADQLTQTLQITVTPAQGTTLAVIRNGANGQLTKLPPGNDQRIDLEVFPPETNNPDKITWRVRFNNDVFTSSTNFGVTVNVELRGGNRIPPGPVQNLIGSSDQTVLHQAFPEATEVPCECYIEAPRVYYPVQGCTEQHRWFGRRRR